MKLLKMIGLGALLALGSSVSLADETEYHGCTGEALPLTQESQLIAAIECLFDARIIKLEEPLAQTWQQQQKTYQGKKIYKIRFLQEDGKIRNLLVDLYTGLPVDEDIVALLRETKLKD